MQGMSVCTLAHLWGGSNSYGQISAPQGSYTKSHLMKWSEYISIPMIQRTSVEFWYKGHFYWRIKNEIDINIYKIHLNFVIHRFGGRGATKKRLAACKDPNCHKDTTLMDGCHATIVINGIKQFVSKGVFCRQICFVCIFFKLKTWVEKEKVI